MCLSCNGCLISGGKMEYLECKDCDLKCGIRDLPEYKHKPRLFWKEHGLQCPECFIVDIIISEEGEEPEACKCGGTMVKPQQFRCLRCGSANTVIEMREL